MFVHVQAYLSRKLRDDLGLHVLALDSNTIQSRGAARRELSRKLKKSRPNGSASTSTESHPQSITGDPSVGTLTYETVMITEASLLETTDVWIRNTVYITPPSNEACIATAHSSPHRNVSATNGGSAPTSRQIPLMFVALHACGSLTPSIFRAFISSLRNEDRAWHPQGAVVAGCCYNLIHPSGTGIAHSPHSPRR